MPTRGRSVRVLILANESMSAALVGLLVERNAYEPAFPLPGESPVAALQRVRPLLVILLDEALDVARSDLFYTRAARSGVQVILWGASTRSAETEALAHRRGVPSFTLPITPADLAPLLVRAAEDVDRRGGGAERRTPAAAMSDGGLVFTDRHGQRWHVYDRRSGERRRTRGRKGGRAGAGSPEYRVFVNEAGEEWRYPLPEDDDGDTSPQTLERQLDVALRS